MGLNPLWLTEWPCEKMLLHAGTHWIWAVGRLSSIFLAIEYGVRLWAADLWIKPTDNYERIRQAGIEDHVFPILADAGILPFAVGYFGAILCTDAYIYFGTDDLYLDYLYQFVKSGGQIGITVPGFMCELKGKLPGHLLPFWTQECWTWHTAGWWRWERTKLMQDVSADALSDGWKFWLQWKKARARVDGEKTSLMSDIQVRKADKGRYMGFI